MLGVGVKSKIAWGGQKKKFAQGPNHIKDGPEDRRASTFSAHLGRSYEKSV